MSSDEDRSEIDRIGREIAARVAATDLREHLEARGGPYYTLGPNGRVVTDLPARACPRRKPSASAATYRSLDADPLRPAPPRPQASPGE